MQFVAIGSRTRKERRLQELTQEQLAELAGVSTAHIGQIERGTRRPSLMALYAICAALGVPMADVLVGD